MTATRADIGASNTGVYTSAVADVAEIARLLVHVRDGPDDWTMITVGDCFRSLVARECACAVDAQTSFIACARRARVRKISLSRAETPEAMSAALLKILDKIKRSVARGCYERIGVAMVERYETRTRLAFRLTLGDEALPAEPIEPSKMHKKIKVYWAPPDRR